MTASSKSGDVGLTGRRIIGDGDDRPRDDLARRVIRDVTTAVGVDHDRVQRLRRHQEVFLLRADAARVGRRVFEDQDVVVTRLEQRALQVIRLREGDPSEVTTPQHLALAFDVETRRAAARLVRGSSTRSDRLTDRWSKESPKTTRRPTPTVATPSLGDDDRHLAHGTHREDGDLGLDDDRLGPQRVARSVPRAA